MCKVGADDADGRQPRIEKEEHGHAKAPAPTEHSDTSTPSTAPNTTVIGPERIEPDAVNDKQILITGATNGIGLAAAEALAALGANLAIVGRCPRREEPGLRRCAARRASCHHRLGWRRENPSVAYLSGFQRASAASR